MRRLARVVLMLQLAGGALLAVTQVSASAQPSASASPSPAASSSEPSPAGSTAPSSPEPASPGATPSPAPAEPSPLLETLSPPPESPTPSVGPSGSPVVEVQTRSLELIAQVGDEVHYRVTVSNPGEVPLERVFVVDLLPSEVTFVSADLLPEVEATLYNRLGRQESITWNVGELAPGAELVLEWTGTATSAGDMTALNAVRAVAGGAPRVRRETSTFLATTATLGGANPAPSPTTTTVVTYERVPAGTTLGAPDGAAGETAAQELPETGFDGRLAVAVAVMLVGLGMLIWWAARPGPGRRRRVALALGALALLAACTTGREAEQAGPAPTGTPEVKGRRIGPDGEVRDLGERDRAGNRDGQGERAREPAPTPAPDPEVADVADDPVTRLVRRTNVVTIEPVLQPAVRLESRSGDTVVGYGWDGAALTSVTSSTSEAGDSPATIDTSVAESDGAMRALVTVSNESARTPIVVHGRLHYEIAGSGGGASLASAPLSLTLQPGGRTAVSFTYDLPAGSYSGAASFRAR